MKAGSSALSANSVRRGREAKVLKQQERVRGLGTRIHLLSAPEGSLEWALGMKYEIQEGIGQASADQAYIGECVRGLLRSGAWRLLRSANGTSFTSFMQFCYGRRPHGLGLTRARVEAVLD
jgi:hypothetical protein